MTDTEFNALVERLTIKAKTHPARYRLEVLGLALIGYLYILVLVIGALVASVAVLLLGVLKPIILLKGLKVIWLPIWFAWSVLRAMWVSFPAPLGRELKPEEAPVLFAEIETIRQAIAGPRPQHVLITDDYNAAVVQRPRLGPLGWSSNYLILGLPMMAALSPQQMRAVIAHEFGHLGAGDSRMTGRIYHMRITWDRLQQQFAARGGLFFRKFFGWFGPWFNAYSFVLARAQEYAADAAAARLVGAGPAAEALVLADLGGEYQSQRIWRPIWERTRHEEQPAAPPYTQMLTQSRGYAEWSDAEARLEKSMQRRTDSSDTHPALNDRLAAIGQPARLPPVQGESAAVAFLGATAQTLAKELDEQWRTSVAERWRERHQQIKSDREALEKLEAEAVKGPLERGADWQRACLIESQRDADAAMPFYQAHLERFPDSGGARYAIGRLLLQSGDDAGLAMIDEVMKADGNAIKPGAELAYNYLMTRERKDEAEKYRLAWNERNDLDRAAEAERAQFGALDDYEPHGLSEDTIAKLRSASATLAWLGGVWMVRKKLMHFPERPAFLLLVKPRWYKRIKPAQAVAEVRKALDLADGLTVAVHNNDLKALFAKAIRVAGSEVYKG